MKKVVVLMSTYNGDQYIVEQIDSILNQTYKNIAILVRDDGSSDNSTKILKEYEKNNEIELIIGDNRGFIRSFFDLIKHSPKGDYYAFCDQDDIWMSEKIERAVRMLEKSNNALPCLYFSDYDYYDQDMQYVGRCISHKKGPSFKNSLVDCISLGISSVFNEKACVMMKEKIPQDCCGHDWWAYMLCAGLGEVIYDNTPTVKYRRHSSNVSPGGMGFIKFQAWRIKKFLVNDYFKQVRKQIKEFYKLYGSELSDDNRRELKLFADDKRFVNALKKLFSIRLYRQKISDEMMLRVMFLIGKL